MQTNYFTNLNEVLNYYIIYGWCEEGHPATKNLLQFSQG